MTKNILAIKLSTIVAFTGLATVLITMILNLFSLADPQYRTMMFVVGFTLMLLGTLWKVVLEMNREE